MLTYIIRRLLLATPILLGVALVCFMLVHMTPGDPWFPSCRRTPPKRCASS